MFSNANGRALIEAQLALEPVVQNPPNLIQRILTVAIVNHALPIRTFGVKELTHVVQQAPEHCLRRVSEGSPFHEEM